MTADLLAKGTTYLRRTLQKHAAQTVVFQRGTAKVQLRATPGSTLVEMLGEDVSVTRRTKDWIVHDRNKLRVNGAAVEPQEGDKIIWRYNQQDYTYIVTPVSGNAYESADGFEQGWRIHTQLDSIA